MKIFFKKNLLNFQIYKLMLRLQIAQITRWGVLNINLKGIVPSIITLVFMALQSLVKSDMDGCK